MSVGCILVFDVTKIKSFDKVKNFIEVNRAELTYRNRRGVCKNAGKFYIIGDTSQCEMTFKTSSEKKD